MSAIDNLEALAKAADRGPWRAGRSDTVSYDANGGAPYKYVYGTEYEKHPRTGDNIPIEVARGEGGNCIANAQHIAALDPETTLKLVAIIRSAQRAFAFIGVDAQNMAPEQMKAFDAALAALETT